MTLEKSICEAFMPRILDQHGGYGRERFVSANAKSAVLVRLRALFASPFVCGCPADRTAECRLTILGTSGPLFSQ